MFFAGTRVVPRVSVEFHGQQNRTPVQRVRYGMAFGIPHSVPVSSVPVFRGITYTRRSTGCQCACHFIVALTRSTPNSLGGPLVSGEHIYRSKSYWQGLHLFVTFSSAAGQALLSDRMFQEQFLWLVYACNGKYIQSQGAYILQ